MEAKHTATPRLEEFKDTCGDYEKPHQYIKRLHVFAGELEIECATLKKKADAHDDLVKALQWCASHAYAGGKLFGDTLIVKAALAKAGVS